MKGLTRRQAILASLAVPLLGLEDGCRASLPAWPASDSSRDAQALLRDSASAHGLSALSAMHDVNVSYAGHWRWLVGKIQPALVDAGFRGGSEERLLLRDGMIAQSHTGPKGHKQVVRVNAPSGSDIRVWFNGEAAHDRDRLDAAALVTEAYALFLLGPMLLVVNEFPHRVMVASLTGSAEVRQDGQAHLCDLVSLKIKPGIGNSESDQLALHIDRQTRLMRRVRMTLNGLESTQGALVDIDTFDHRSLHGIQWPTTFHERLLRPAPLDVHSWKLTGLDIDRGLSAADFTKDGFSARASVPATPLNVQG